MRNIFVSSLVCGFLTLGVVATSNANLLMNGSFEDPNIPERNGNPYYQILSDTLVPGWSSQTLSGYPSQNMMEIWTSGFGGIGGGYTTPVNAQDLNQFIELNANYVSDVYQDVPNFIAGDVLDWSFWHRARTDYNPSAVDTLGFRILEFGTGNTVLYTHDPSPFGFSSDGSKWWEKAGTITVQNAGVLRFLWTSETFTSVSVGNFLDNASLTVHRDPVPEPATMLLFGTGIAALTGLRLRRKK